MNTLILFAAALVPAITVASYMAPARKVRIRLRPITQYL